MIEQNTPKDHPEEQPGTPHTRQHPETKNTPHPVERTDGRTVRLSAQATQASKTPKALAAEAKNTLKGGFTVRKKFGGTEAQIRSALTFYKWCAWISGTFLLLLVVEMVSRYGLGFDLVAGAQEATTGKSVVLGVLNRESGNLTGGVNISTGVLIVHGWFYVIYLISCFRIWLLMRWGIAQFIVMALGGVVPFLSFIVEKRIHAETLAQLEANPQATKRY